MHKLKCVVSYDGTNYAGFQIQNNAHTIQAEIEKVLQTIHKNHPIKIYVAGRTDKGVHAIAQVFHFETNITMPMDNWKKAINGLLPDDIFVKDIAVVRNDFHARYHAQNREYRYEVLHSEDRNVFERDRAYLEYRALDFAQMRQACKVFCGTHDFTAFSSAKDTVKGSKVRTLHEVSMHRQGDRITFILRGDGFLYNMVRIIVGTILAVGKQQISVADIERMFADNKRKRIIKTLPAHGLYLWHVAYDEEWLI